MRSTEFQSSLELGHRHFLAGRCLDAHEAWEHGWLATRGVEKQLLQVLVLWATAYHHARNDNRTGSINLMRRALERLEKPSITRAPFDVEALRDALVLSWEALSKAGPIELQPPAWEPTAVEQPSEDVELTARSRCPYCGEPVAVEVDPALAGGAEYVEDCPVCCHPWTVVVREEAGQMAVILQRGDE